MWYRINARFGPGHQSKDWGYFWSGRRLSRADKQAVFEDTYRDRSWPVGHVRLVRRLPKRVIEQKIRNCKAAIRGNQEMLEILATTPVRRTPDMEELRERHSRAQLAKLRRETERRAVERQKKA